MSFDGFEFKPFPKMARLSRECIITEKIDGTNASIFIEPAGLHFSCTPGNLDIGATAKDGFVVMAGSRTRWVTPDNDNYGFARWVRENRAELIQLGPGHHFGEWWGAGIQRRYGLAEKRFSLFNVSRWVDVRQHPLGSVLSPEQALCPMCCHVVPTLYRGNFDTLQVECEIRKLKYLGSVAAPGFEDPEGIVVYHTASQTLFKKTIKDDEKPKSQV